MGAGGAVRALCRRGSVVGRDSGCHHEALERLGGRPHRRPPSEGLLGLLDAAVGPGVRARDVTFGQVCRGVPPSRLGTHRLIDTASETRARYARGQSLPDLIAMRSGRGLTFPDGVARPGSEAEAAELLAYAFEQGVRLIPYGGGTSVVGHVNPLPGPVPTLTVALERLAACRGIDPESRLATFETGVRGPDLEARLRASGLTLGHFPQSFEYSTLGGWIATRSSGQESLGYGRIEDLFAGGTVLTPGGRLVLKPFPASAAGPDLRHLVLGSEGRLGVLTEATIRVKPLPEAERLNAVVFPNWVSGLDGARALAQSGLPLSMIRLSTPSETATNLALAGHSRAVQAVERLLRLRGIGAGRCMALVGFGDGPLLPAVQALAIDTARRHGGVGLGSRLGKIWRKNRFRLPYLRNSLWELGYAVDTVGTATTWDKVPGTATAVERALSEALREQGERIHVGGHLSHVYPSGASIYATFVFRADKDPDATLERWRLVKAAASEAIVRAGGTISHQHGVGSDHASYLAAEKGLLGMRALGRLCSGFDERGLLNPGKLLLEPTGI